METFHVKLMYDNAMPVSYIHYTVDGGKPEGRMFSPSMAMVFVRKYLEDKLKDHPTVEFQMLRPSPFHADILLWGPEVESTGNANPVVSEDLTKVGDGYRTLFFTIHWTGEEKVFQFVREHQAVLAAYYSIIRLRNCRRSLRTAVFDGAAIYLMIAMNIARGESSCTGGDVRGGLTLSFRNS